MKIDSCDYSRLQIEQVLAIDREFGYIDASLYYDAGCWHVGGGYELTTQQGMRLKEILRAPLSARACSDTMKVYLPNNKETGRKNDGDKVHLDLLPEDTLIEIAKVLTEGAKKYSPGNWKNVPNPEDRYYAALLRHLYASRLGEKNDSETGLSHLAHAGCNLLFLLWRELNDNTAD